MGKARNSAWGFGIGYLGIMLPSTAFSMFYSYYYVDKLGLALGLYTLGRTIYVFVDLFATPIAGFLSDRTRTRWGRRLPWMVGAIPFYVLFFILVYSAPAGATGTKLFIWFLAFQMLFETTMAVLFVNYQSLFPELFKSAKSRARASVWQQAFYIVALLVGTALTPILYNALGFSNMAICYALTAVVFLVLCMTLLREDKTASETKPMGIIAAFKETAKNGPFWLYAVANMFGGAMLGMVSATMVFYCKYVLKIGDAEVSLLMGVTFLCVIPMAVLWYLIVRRWGSLRSWQTSTIVSAITVIPLFFARDLTTGLVCGVILSFGLAGNFVTPPLIQSDLIDVDAFHTGQRREGIYTAVANFVVRCSALITAISFWVVGLSTGYVSGDVPGPNPVLTFRILSAGVPIVLMLISFVMAMCMKRAWVTVPDSGSDGAPQALEDVSPSPQLG